MRTHTSVINGFLFTIIGQGVLLYGIANMTVPTMIEHHPLMDVVSIHK